jgi:hypothetical protein
MNKEQQDVLEDAYKNYAAKTSMDVDGQYTKEEFINRIKTDGEFAKTWGLKIEERELDMFERWKIADLTPNMMEIDYCNKLCDEYNVPTKLITITYNDKTITSYE